MRRFFLGMPNEQVRPYINASLGGILAGLALSQLGSVFMPFGIAFLWATGRSPIVAGVWGAIAVLISHSWLLALHPLTWIGVPYFLSFPVALAIWIFCGGFAAVLVCFWSALGKYIFDSIVFDKGLRAEFWHALLMSSLWGFSEVILSKLPLFWIGLGSSLFPGNLYLAGNASWIGEGGLATILLLSGWWIWKTTFAFLKNDCWQEIFLFGLVFLFLFHLLGWSLLSSSEPYDYKKIAGLQTSIATREKFSREEQFFLNRTINNSLVEANKLGADLLIAPEGTLSVNTILDEPAQIAFLSGGFRWINGRQRSSLLLFPKGESEYTYAIDKHRLVPLGEWVPEFLNISFGSLSAIGGIQPGSDSRLFNYTQPPLAVAICYELSDGFHLAKAVEGGAEWLLTIANLDPYPLSLQRQFLALSRLRSIETSRELISVANTGPTIISSPSGKITELVSPYQKGLGVSNVHFYKEINFYVRWKETPLIIFILISLGGIFFDRFKFN